MATNNTNPMTTEQLAAARATNDALAREFTLTPTTKASGALFDFEGKSDGSPRRDTDALMTGNIEFDVAVGDGAKAVTVALSAFRKEAEGTGRVYLSLSLGVAGGTHYNGKLFNNMEALDRKDTSPDYSGFIHVLPVFTNDDGTTTKYTSEEWDAAPQVQVFGRRKWAAGTDKAYIKLDVVPRRNNAPVPNNAIAF
jgi:hypothetical protein